MVAWPQAFGPESQRVHFLPGVGSGGQQRQLEARQFAGAEQGAEQGVAIIQVRAAAHEMQHAAAVVGGLPVQAFLLHLRGGEAAVVVAVLVVEQGGVF